MLVHPTAEVEAGATFGEGTRVWHQAHIRRGAEAPADLRCADCRQRDAGREDR